MTSVQWKVFCQQTKINTSRIIHDRQLQCASQRDSEACEANVRGIWKHARHLKTREALTTRYQFSFLVLVAVRLCDHQEESFFPSISVKWGWLAYTTSTVRDTCTFAVLCSVLRPFFVASLVFMTGTSCCVIRRNSKWNLVMAKLYRCTWFPLLSHVAS